jgi:hypothetical protein
MSAHDYNMFPLLDIGTAPKLEEARDDLHYARDYDELSPLFFHYASNRVQKSYLALLTLHSPIRRCPFRGCRCHSNSIRLQHHIRRLYHLYHKVFTSHNT